MNILFVENHQVFAEVVIKQFFVQHHVNVVPTIRKAWEEITQNNYDVVLVDFDLDDGKGVELVTNSTIDSDMSLEWMKPAALKAK